MNSVESRYRNADSQALEAKPHARLHRNQCPFTGIVTRKLADVGDLASPGKPLLELE
jgi:multidrug resistance efflux pump